MPDDYELTPVEYDPYAGTGMSQFRAAVGAKPPTGPITTEPQNFPEYVAQSMAAGIGNLAATPRKAYREGLTPEEEIGFGANVAAGMIGTGTAFAPRGVLGAAGGALAVRERAAAPPFYSAVADTVANAKTERAPASQWLGTLKNAPGVKPDEVQWLGLENWLKGQQGPVSKADVADYVRAHQVELKEVTKGPIPEGGTALPRQDFTKFSQWQLPGGENYREMLLTLPTERSPAIMERAKQIAESPIEYGIGKWEELNQEGQQYYINRARAEAKLSQETQFTSSHWDEPNVLAHVRFNDRTIDGKKTLFLEEIQSDWHQKGRSEGYKISEAEKTKLANELQQLQAQRANPNTPRETLPDIYRREGEVTDAFNRGVHDAVPDAPFKTTWPELALKRMVRHAAENGYDQIAWTPGEVQAARYDLSKHVKEIEHIKRGYVMEGDKPVDTWDLGVVGHNGEGIPLPNNGRMTLKQIEETLGKEMAEKISKGEGTKYRGHEGYTLEGLDLKVGGEGMRGFYDKMLPAAANKLGKKFGAKVEQQHVGVPHKGGEQGMDIDVHTMPITPAMRQTAITKGFPLFQGGLPILPPGDRRSDKRHLTRIDHDPF